MFIEAYQSSSEACRSENHCRVCTCHLSHVHYPSVMLGGETQSRMLSSEKPSGRRQLSRGCYGAGAAAQCAGGCLTAPLPPHPISMMSPLYRVTQAAPPSGCSERQLQSFILMSLLSRVMTRTRQETRSFSVKPGLPWLGPRGLSIPAAGGSVTEVPEGAG